MIFLMIICLALIPLGIWMVLKPKAALEVQDMFRVQGKRVYTDFAIVSTQVSGVFICILGLGGVIFSIIEMIK